MRGGGGQQVEAGSVLSCFKGAKSNRIRSKGFENGLISR